MKVSNTSERLKQYMSEHHLKQVDILARAEPYCKQNNVKMNKSDLSQYVSGKTEPGQDKLFVLARALNVTEAWLIGYDVPIEHNNHTIQLQEEINEESNIDFKQQKILENYNNMNEKGRDKLLDYSNFLISNLENLKSNPKADKMNA